MGLPVSNEDKEPSDTTYHTGKVPAILPSNGDCFHQVLKAVDREVAFYRKRAGQVIFFTLLLEALLLTGQADIEIPGAPFWVEPVVYSSLFMAVAFFGVTLASEYRSRIRMLKDSRIQLLKEEGYQNVYPSETDQKLSEIQVLYIVLAILSSSGIFLVWLEQLYK